MYDRHWMIVTDSGVCLTQKREPRLCHIKPSLDLNKGVLSLTAPGTYWPNVVQIFLWFKNF